MLIPDCSLSNAETQRDGHFNLLSPLTSQCEQFYQIADVAKVLNLGGGRERCRRTPARDCGSREKLQWGVMWEAGGKWALQVSQELADPRGPSHVFLKPHYSCVLVVSPTQTSTCSQSLISSCNGSSYGR